MCVCVCVCVCVCTRTEAGAGTRLEQLQYDGHVQMDWIQILTLILTSCVTLGKLFNHSVPLFLVCKRGLL